MAFNKKATYLCLFLLAFTAHALYAQTWNKAVFRNDEIDPRDYFYNKEYFLNVFAYQPGSYVESSWLKKHNGYLVSAGSLKSDEFYVKQQAKIGAKITPNLSFLYQMTQDEDFDSRYLRHRPGFVYSFDQAWALYAFGEGTAYKEDNDICVGALVSPWKWSKWEAQATFVDFNEGKGKDNRHLNRDGYGLLFKNTSRITQDLWVSATAHLQPGFTLKDPGEDLEFHFKKNIYESRLGWRFADQRIFSIYLTAEQTDKNTEYSINTIDNLKINRHSFVYGAECFFEEVRGRSGFRYFQFRERNFHPGDLLNNEKQERDEFTLYGDLEFTLGDKLFFQPGLFLDYVSQNFTFHNNIKNNDRYHGFQGKLTTGFEFRFKRGVSLFVIPSLDLDEMNWGGGNVQFVAWF